MGDTQLYSSHGVCMQTNLQLVRFGDTHAHTHTRIYIYIYVYIYIDSIQFFLTNHNLPMVLGSWGIHIVWSMGFLEAPGSASLLGDQPRNLEVIREDQFKAC